MIEQRTPDCRGCEHNGNCSEEQWQECQNELENQEDDYQEDLRLFRGEKC